MKNKTSGIFATIFFTLISILFVSPILIVLMNSFKKKAFNPTLAQIPVSRQSVSAR